MLLGALILACVGATRLGGEFVQLFFQRLCENAECLLECGACNFCAGGRDVVWDVLSARKNPFTYAHLPQKAAAKACANIIEHAQGRAFTADEETRLKGYIAVYWAGLHEDRRSGELTHVAYEHWALAN